MGGEEDTENLLDKVEVFDLNGNVIPISDLWKERKAVVAFARHFGLVFLYCFMNFCSFFFFARTINQLHLLCFSFFSISRNISYINCLFILVCLQMCTLPQTC